MEFHELLLGWEGVERRGCIFGRRLCDTKLHGALPTGSEPAGQRCYELSIMGGHDLFVYLCVLPDRGLPEGRIYFLYIFVSEVSSTQQKLSWMKLCSLWISHLLFFAGAEKSALIALFFSFFLQDCYLFI